MTIAEQLLSDMTLIQESFIKSTQKALAQHGWQQDTKKTDIYRHPNLPQHEVEVHYNGGIYHTSDKKKANYTMPHKVKGYLKDLHGDHK